jgi:hypothetical protein
MTRVGGALLSLALLAAPLAGEAPPREKIPRIGFLSGTSPSAIPSLCPTGGFEGFLP